MTFDLVTYDDLQYVIALTLMLAILAVLVFVASFGRE